MSGIEIIENEAPEVLDLIVTEKAVGYLNTNISQLEKLVEKRLEDYKPEKYSGDADLAKKDRAELNKAKEKIGRARKDLIADLMKPYKDFEDRCKALEKKIDLASNALDEIVKVKEQEEKDIKKNKIELMWKAKGFELFPLEKIFNQKWLNKTFKESDILEEIESRIEKTYKDLKICERYSEMYAIDCDMVKGHYLMNLDIEETITYCDELQRQKEIAQKEAAEREEREHEKQIQKQKTEVMAETAGFEKKQEINNLADLALAEAHDEEVQKPMRSEYVINVCCFESELLKLKAEMNGLGIEFTVKELQF